MRVRFTVKEIHAISVERLVLSMEWKERFIVKMSQDSEGIIYHKCLKVYKHKTVQQTGQYTIARFDNNVILSRLQFVTGIRMRTTTHSSWWKA